MSRRPRKEAGGVQVREENKGVGESKEMGPRTLALVAFPRVGLGIALCGSWGGGHDCAPVCLSPFLPAPPLPLLQRRV